jgi:hypothetical protein
MTTSKRAAQILILLGSCGAAALFLQLWNQVPGFTFVKHAFVFKPGAWLLLTGMLFVALAVVWAVSATVLAEAGGVSYHTALGLDMGTYLPLFLLALAPLSLIRYLDWDDLNRRLTLFIIAALGAVLYLKVVRGALLVRETAPAWLRRARHFFGWPRRRQLVCLFAAAVIIFNAGSVLMFLNGATFGGDEPHYLMIAESLLRDGDVDLADNYAARSYERFLQPGAAISPHVLPGRKPGGQYSFHSPGTAAVLLPFYALGGAFGKAGIILLVRFGLSLFGALLGLQMYLYALRKFGKDRVSLLLWLLFSFTVPVFFYSIHVYPEIIVSLFAFTAYRVFRFSEKIGRFALAGLGLLVSSFVWFHALKYFFILVPLLLYGLWVVARKHRSPRDAVWLLAPAAVNLGLYFLFQYSIYGSLNPTSVSWQGAMDGQQTVGFLKELLTGIPLRFRIDTLLGYFLDQRDGLLFTAPVYFLGFLGLIEIGRRRLRELWLLLLIIAPYILVSAALTQRTGYAPPARPLIAVIWGPAILMGYFLAHNTKKLFTFAENLGIGLSLGFVLIFCLHPLALYMETTAGTTERGAGLFYLLGNLHFSIPKILPSFLKIPEWRWAPNFVWPVLILVFMIGYRFARPRAIRLRFPHYQILAAAGLLLFFAWFVFFPRVPLVPERRVALSPSGALSFYALSRVARGGEDGRFALLEDNRDYHFYFATPAPIGKLKIDYGSTAGNYWLKFGIFDAAVFDAATNGTVETRIIESPPAYRWNGKYLYRATIHLERMSDVRTGLNPYVFGIRPVR